MHVSFEFPEDMVPPRNAEPYSARDESVSRSWGSSSRTRQNDLGIILTDPSGGSICSMGEEAMNMELLGQKASNWSGHRGLLISINIFPIFVETKSDKALYTLSKFDGAI